MFNSKTSNISIGKLGEDLACEYLVKNKYKIITRNYRKPWGEIDIVARAKDGTLVFVEVKTLASVPDPGYLTPEDNLSINKLKKLQKICQEFAALNPKLIKEAKGWRIDLLAINIENKNGQAKINHYENI